MSGREGYLAEVSCSPPGVHRWLLAAVLAASALFWSPEPAAEERIVLADVLAKLAIASERFESGLKKASFTAVGRTETVDGDGHVTAVREGTVRFVAHGERHTVEVVRYTEDGADETAAARKKALDAAKKKPDPDAVMHLPFLASEQPKYLFRLGETDPRDRARVRLHFLAREPARTLWNGSAWVDSRNGVLLTMGAAQSKTALFVDHFTGTLEFTPHARLGFAVARATFEGAGGILFFRKRFRGWATLSDYVLP